MAIRRPQSRLRIVRLPGNGPVAGLVDGNQIGGHQIEFNSTDVIIAVVNDSIVNSVISSIMDVAHTGQKGDGKIFVTNVEQSYDISTKEKST